MGFYKSNCWKNNSCRVIIGYSFTVTPDQLLKANIFIFSVFLNDNTTKLRTVNSILNKNQVGIYRTWIYRTWKRTALLTGAAFSTVCSITLIGNPCRSKLTVFVIIILYIKDSFLSYDIQSAILLYWENPFDKTFTILSYLWWLFRYAELRLGPFLDNIT